MPDRDAVEEIVAQVFIAFGQGAGPLRVPRKTVRSMHDYLGRFAAKALPRWDADGTEALERVRLMGRLAAQLAVAAGRLEISAADFARSADTVRLASKTDLCGGDIP